jgi:hypothetical protein
MYPGDQAHSRREDRGEHQQVDQEVTKLQDDGLDGRNLFRFSNLVRSVFLQPALYLGPRESLLAGVEFPDETIDGAGVELVPIPVRFARVHCF